MKVLTDWMTGDPPMPGMWMCRIGSGTWDIKMLLWDGKYWKWPDGKLYENSFEAEVERWRGLSFNPQFARPVECEVYDEKTGRITKNFKVGWVIPAIDE